MSTPRFAYDFNRVPGPPPEEIKNNNGDGALTYGTGNEQSPGYLAAIDSSGLSRALIWEHNTDSILGGWDYGVSEAQVWNRDHPEGHVIYLACDLNDNALGGGDIRPFLAGWATQLRHGDRLGVYGPDNAILQAKGQPAVTRYWGVVNWLDGGYPDNDPRNIERWQQINVDLIQLIGSPIPDTDQNLILRPTWANTGVASGAKDDRKGVNDTMILHNVDIKDPDAKTASGEWCIMLGSDGPTNITAGEAYVYVIAGVPWVDNQRTLNVVSAGVRGAQARKASAVWDAKV